MAKTTREEWSKRIERWKDGGLSAKEFASETGINARSLSWWRWQLERQDKAPTRSRGRRRRKPIALDATNATPMTFVEVSAPAPSALLEVMLERGQRIRVPVGFDAPTLERLLVVLGRTA